MEEKPLRPTRLGERLRQLRRERRITLQELARHLGMHFTTVSSWERGRSEPDLQVLARLAERLGVSVAELLGERAPGQPLLRLAVWGPARWSEFAQRTEALQIATALLRGAQGAAINGGLEEALRGGRLPLPVLLRLASRYRVEALEAPAGHRQGSPGRDAEEVAVRFTELPARVRAEVAGLLLEWLELFSPPPGAAQTVESVGAGSGPPGQGLSPGRPRRRPAAPGRP